jgi:hypothetical protein
LELITHETLQPCTPAVNEDIKSNQLSPAVSHARAPSGPIPMHSPFRTPHDTHALWRSRSEAIGRSVVPTRVFGGGLVATARHPRLSVKTAHIRPGFQELVLQWATPDAAAVAITGTTYGPAVAALDRERQQRLMGALRLHQHQLGLSLMRQAPASELPFQ